jgi:hypothetical protein
MRTLSRREGQHTADKIYILYRNCELCCPHSWLSYDFVEQFLDLFYQLVTLMHRTPLAVTYASHTGWIVSIVYTTTYPLLPRDWNPHYLRSHIKVILRLFLSLTTLILWKVYILMTIVYLYLYSSLIYISLSFLWQSILPLYHDFRFPFRFTSSPEIISIWHVWFSFID